MRGRRQRRRIAGWLGLLALAIQAAIPLLVAGEITLAAEPGHSAVFDLCPLGDHQQTPGKAGHHDEDGGLCPICVALCASPVFLASASAALPLPAFHRIAIAPQERREPLSLLARALYRSRAPPVG